MPDGLRVLKSMYWPVFTAEVEDHVGLAGAEEASASSRESKSSRRNAYIIFINLGGQVQLKISEDYAAMIVDWKWGI